MLPAADIPLFSGSPENFCGTERNYCLAAAPRILQVCRSIDLEIFFFPLIQNATLQFAYCFQNTEFLLAEPLLLFCRNGSILNKWTPEVTINYN